MIARSSVWSMPPRFADIEATVPSRAELAEGYAAVHAQLDALGDVIALAQDQLAA